MKNIYIGIIAIIIFTVSAYLFVNSNKSENSVTPHDMHRMPDGSLMRNDGAPMDHMMMHVESERAFITGMIPHHQEAVDTAKQVLERGGTTAEIKALVENIISAQEREIAQMKAWHEDWYGTPYASDETYHEMMRDLSSLQGKEIDRAFLEDMIPHHRGALMMAESVMPYIEHEEIKKLVEDIQKSQSKEIEDMQKMLEDL